MGKWENGFKRQNYQREKWENGFKRKKYQREKWEKESNRKNVKKLEEIGRHCLKVCEQTSWLMLKPNYRLL